MTCCALVLLLLVQLLAPFTWLWRRIAGSEERVNAAVAWSPSSVPRTAGETSSEGRNSGLLSGRRRRLLVAIAATELLVVAGATAAYLVPSTVGQSQTATSTSTSASPPTATLVAGPERALREPDWLRDFHENVWCRGFGDSTASAAVFVDSSMGGGS